jgi:hypothetical protein
VRASGYRLSQDYKTYSEPKYETILPDDQRKIVEIVKKVGLEHRIKVEIVDMGKGNVFNKIITEKKMKINTFPTLITEA